MQWNHFIEMMMIVLKWVLWYHFMIKSLWYVNFWLHIFAVGKIHIQIGGKASNFQVHMMHFWELGHYRHTYYVVVCSIFNFSNIIFSCFRNPDRSSYRGGQTHTQTENIYFTRVRPLVIGALVSTRLDPDFRIFRKFYQIFCHRLILNGDLVNHVKCTYLWERRDGQNYVLYYYA